MQQVSLFLHGERDYTSIKGSTGSLVYPAAHVYTYSTLYYLTDYGTSIFRAQTIFAILYLVTLSLVFACYRAAQAPPWVFPMLVLSKRAHSIFVLRCFNDCWAVAFLWGAIYAYQNRAWTAGSLAYTWAVGIKMSALLPAPAVGLVLLQALGTERALVQIWIMTQVQVNLN